MTQETCPTCGARCNKMPVPSIIYNPELEIYETVGTTSKLLPLFQPDLTKLREMYELILTDDIDVAIMDFSGSEKIQELWYAIKEVLDAENTL